jgi:uncharacterized DUF497 family protein
VKGKTFCKNGLNFIPFQAFLRMFEFDPAKNAANLTQHGIGFVDAQALWKDDRRLVIDVAHPVEARSAVIGRIDGKIWTAIVTLRGENTRLISVRRARKEEVTLYDSQDDQH